MAIYRGPGGSGDATQDAASEVLLAVQAKNDALAAQAAAEAAQAAAELAETNAETAETNAETAETNAETAATNAANSASAASTSASNAASSASAASTSASNASTSASNAASSASAASTSASNAATSATNAANSATSASTSASTATTQATNASNSASAAATSATNAAGSASAASTSATNAASSATSASNSASTATTQATNAANSATAAATSATNAASSATSASNSASTATTQATNAANSASAAATSATNASSSATSAANSATAAQTAQAAAEAALDQFDDTYLGAKASNPTVDNDGNALTTGDQYFNTVANELRIWNGSSWQSASTVGGTVTSLTVTGAFAANGGATLGDASGDALTINSSAVSIPNGLNFDSNTFVIDATNNRVGIGTASPTVPLDIAGTARITGSNLSIVPSTTTSAAYLLNTNASGNFFFAIDNSTGASFGAGNYGRVIYSSAAYPLVFFTNDTERMRITSTGNVGIGTSNPSFLSGYGGLQINGISTNSAVLKLTNSTTGTASTDGFDILIGAASSDAYVWQRESAPLIFGTASTERMRIDSSGNVGIGITNPADRLSVYIASGDAQAAFGNSTRTNFVGTQGSNYGALATGDLKLYAAGGNAVTLMADNASGTIKFATGGNTERMRVNSNGTVGIGVTGGNAALSFGSIASSTTDRASAIRLFDAGGTNGNNYGFGFDGNSGQFSYTAGTGGYHAFLTANTERMRITSTGNVGIGTGVPAQRFVVSNDNSEGMEIIPAVNAGESRIQSYNRSGAAWNKFSINSGTFELFTNGGTSALFANTSGNVGIGTSSPSSRLSVTGSANIATFDGGTNTSITLTGSGRSDIFLIDSGAATDQKRLTIRGNDGNFVFGVENDAVTTFTERMRITSDGYVCVGVAGTLNASMIVARTPTGSTGYGFRSDGVNAAGTTWGHFYGTSSTNSVANIIIYGNGNIVNANNSYGSLSDVKLKENIVDTTPKLEKLTQVRVVNYNLIGDTQKQLGVVAQELEQIFPSMIEETPDRDEEGNDLGTTTKSVKYSVFVPILIKAIQEQQAIINELKTRIETLENK